MCKSDATSSGLMSELLLNFQARFVSARFSMSINIAAGTSTPASTVIIKPIGIWKTHTPTTIVQKRIAQKPTQRYCFILHLCRSPYQTNGARLTLKAISTSSHTRSVLPVSLTTHLHST